MTLSTTSSAPCEAPATVDLAAHGYAIDCSGYTIIRSQLDSATLEYLRTIADHALEATRRTVSAGLAPQHTWVNDGYVIARRLYHWSDHAFALLDHDLVHALADRMFAGGFRLYDLTVNASYPHPRDPVHGTGWHRDFGDEDLCHGTSIPSHLYCFFCLDDLTADNGGTWIVPGSHHRTRQPPPPILVLDDPPSAVRIEARAGDLVVMNPSTLHRSGLNHSGHARRMVSFGLCHRRMTPACDHWRGLSAAQRTRASPRVQSLLSATWESGHAAWAVLPDGSVSGPPVPGTHHPHQA